MEYLGYFFLGLGLNLTPCVYPMLAITISLFQKSEKASSWQAFTRAICYVSGIIVMYTTLGTLAAYTGGFFGGLLQNFWVLLLVGFFVLALALSMFGLYTFRLPSWLTPQQRGSRHVAIELFFSGLLVGIIAAPCMGPVVLSLLAHVSQQRNPALGGFSFFVLALGLGTPYLILGTFSRFLEKMPKSGAWLVWFERLLGVILFSLGCFYLIIAFDWPMMPWLIPVTCLVGGVYLGWVERSSQKSKRFSIFQKIMGSLFTIAGVVMISGLFSASPKTGIVWENYRAGMLEEAQASGQPVILDFYADWCIPCHELDQFTYSSPSVKLALENFRKIKVNTTTMESEENQEVLSRFDIFGVPTVLFLDEQGEEVDELRIEGYISAEELVDLLLDSRLAPVVKVKENESSF